MEKEKGQPGRFPAAFRLDCSGHLCPVPILMAEEKIADLAPGSVLEVVFTDPGARPDLLAWCRSTGHECLGFKEGASRAASAYIRKKKA